MGVGPRKVVIFFGMSNGGPVLEDSRRSAPFPLAPALLTQPDIPTLRKPDILILRRHSQLRQILTGR